jgi:hypothetical protein
MATISFDLASLFEQTYGYKTGAFDPKFNPVVRGNGRVSAQGSPYYGLSQNVEYYLPVTLSYSSDGASNLVDVTLPHPVVSISCRKTIVETVLTERRGTAKELINSQDFQITIKGFIIGSDNEFPEEQMTKLRDLYELNRPLSIKCPLTDIFLVRPGRRGSDQVVIQELKLPFVTGVKNVRPYELSLLSDEAFNLVKLF